MSEWLLCWILFGVRHCHYVLLDCDCCENVCGFFWFLCFVALSLVVLFCRVASSCCCCSFSLERIWWYWHGPRFMESWSVGMMVWYVLFGYLVSPRFFALLVCDCSFCFPSESLCLCGYAVSCCRLLPVCCAVACAELWRWWMLRPLFSFNSCSPTGVF